MSLWNLDLDRFNETDFLMEQAEKREEFISSICENGLASKKCKAVSKPTPNQEIAPCPSSSV